MLVFGTNNLFISKEAREVRRKRVKTVQAELFSAAIQAIQETIKATKRWRDRLCYNRLFVALRKYRYLAPKCAYSDSRKSTDIGDN